jgi:hypothetical protein
MRHLTFLPIVALTVLGLAPPAMAQTDSNDWEKMALGEAALACRNNDPDSFFDTFLESPAVRRAYTAEALTVITNTADGRVEARIAGAEYTDFPLGMVDYYRVTTIGPARESYAHIKHEINQSSDNRLRVDWVSVFYDGNSEGGDDQGKVIGTGDDPGTLLFYPTDTCWELVQVEVTIASGS